MFGASFSVPYAQYLGLNPKECLASSIDDLGVRRLRLMSYWDRLEPVRGKYDFRELDWQIAMAEAKNVEVTLCLGLRQPRWPESHWPEWAIGSEGWQAALEEFISRVIGRYSSRKCIISYQLENEAMLKRFGQKGNFDRRRLKKEFKLIKSLDSSRPIIMSTSDSWGIPIFGPRPDIYGFSIYRHFFDRGEYKHSRRPAIFYFLRGFLIRCLKARGVFIHELQAEPWGPEGIPDMTLEEQYKSMDLDKIRQAIEFAKKTKLYPIDVWGLEWWYWLKTKEDSLEVWDYMRSVYS